MAQARAAMTPALLIASKRDPRIDVLRGIALVMIFVDHIPGNTLSLVTLRNFGFSDAAEVFVLLAGMSSMLAFGRVFEREGARSGLRRIVLRLARIYLFQIGLLLTTLAVVLLWTTHHQLTADLGRANSQCACVWYSAWAYASRGAGLSRYPAALPRAACRLPSRISRPAV